MNEQIRLSPILLIDENDNRVGEIATHDALRRARDLGLDLVEVAADARPPVCRIMDYGKWKYEQAKKDKANKAKSKQQELKEVRLGRSMKIDPHDIAIRLRKAREFLMEGHKVQIVQNFRGREMQHIDRGYKRMREIVEDLADVSKVEVPPRQSGRRMSLILGPDKQKIDQIKRREAKEKKAAEAATSEGETPSVADDAVAKSPDPSVEPKDAPISETVEASSN
ncbi:MAG: translation initiation factor IF-3 [Phycisphaerales bacterium]